jgi:hypothetical protein
VVREAAEREARRAAEKAAKEAKRAAERAAKAQVREAARAAAREAKAAEREAKKQARAEERLRKRDEAKIGRRKAATLAGRRKRGAIIQHEVGALLARACEVASQATGHPCEVSAVVNRDGTVDGELRIPAAAIDVEEILTILELSGVWRGMDHEKFWISVGYTYTVDPRHQVKAGEAPGIVGERDDDDDDEEEGLKPSDWRKRYWKRAGTYQELAHPQRLRRLGENFATARTILHNLIRYGFRVREILVRVFWSETGERPPGKHE